LVSSASFLRHLYRHMVSNHSVLISGGASLQLSLSALTLLHQRREELQQLLSDRDAVREGRANELKGMQVFMLNKLFLLLSSLVRSSTHCHCCCCWSSKQALR
jgi:hypothetical protein